jgi:hypothetical protein
MTATNTDLVTFAEELQNALGDLATGSEVYPEYIPGIEGATITSYSDGGYLTSDEGFVVRFPDGAEFHVIVKQSRYSAVTA